MESPSTVVVRYRVGCSIRLSPRTGPCDKVRATEATMAMQEARRDGSKRRDDWLTIIHPRASRESAFLDASPDICRRVTLPLVSRTSTQTLAHDEKFRSVPRK